MWIDEHIVIPKSERMQSRKAIRQGAWCRRAVLRALWDLRLRYLTEGVDIFNVRQNGDNVEFTLKGEIDASPIDKATEHRSKTRINIRNKRRGIAKEVE